jgi:hypothetical protein
MAGVRYSFGPRGAGRTHRHEARSMKISTLLAVVPVLLAMSVAAEAACVYPQAPQSLPNGSQATGDEMKAANAQVKEYSKTVQEVYLPCLEQEKIDATAALDNMDPDYTSKKTSIDAIHAKKHNAAIDELQALATRWNSEIKAFKDKAAK